MADDFTFSSNFDLVSTAIDGIIQREGSKDTEQTTASVMFVEYIWKQQVMSYSLFSLQGPTCHVESPKALFVTVNGIHSILCVQVLESALVLFTGKS